MTIAVVVERCGADVADGYGVPLNGGQAVGSRGLGRLTRGAGGTIFGITLGGAA